MEETKAPVLKTPQHNIPIGVPYKKDGHYGIRMKKAKGQEYEDLSLDHLISMVVTEADNQEKKPQVPQVEGTAARRTTP